MDWTGAKVQERVRAMGRAVLVAAGLRPSRSGLPAKAERTIALARLALFWEGFWPKLAAALAPGLLFVGLAFFGAFDRYPGIPHALVFAAVVSATLVLVYRALRESRWPSREAAMARIEAASEARHQPLRALTDRPAEALPEDSFGRALWRAHRARLAKLLSGLKSPWPRAQLSPRDPFALRFALVLFVFVGALVAGSDRGPRMERALAPSIDASERRAPPILEAWIQPPAYTGLAPLHLLSGDAAPAASEDPELKTVPMGSELLVRASNARQGLRLVAEAHGVDETPPVPVGFETKDDARLEARLRLDETTSVVLGPARKPFGHWMIRVRTDSPPIAEFTGPAAQTPHGSLTFPIAVEDDFGITRAELTIEPEGAGAEGRIQVPIAVPSGPNRFEDRVLRDLTDHPRAGRPAKAWLTVWDAPGQRGQSPEILVLLPERTFRTPLAQALAEQRRHLLDDPGAGPRVARVLDALAAGEERYLANPRHYLALRGAYWRLTHGKDATTAEEAADILWNLALAIEDQGLTAARQELQARIDALKEALANGASEEEIAQRMADVREALERYLAALAQQGTQTADGPSAPSGQSVDASDIRDYLDRLSDALQTGSADEAQRMLSDLGAVIDSLRPEGQQGQGAEGSPVGEALAGLSDLVAKQRELIDETHRARIDGDTRALSDLAGRQQDLADETRALGDTLQDADIKTPLELDLARHAMGSAGSALESQRAGRAMDAQGRAVEALREAAEEIIQSMTGNEGQGQGAQQAGPGLDQGGGMGQGDRPGHLDPLGRQSGSQGPALGAAVDLPSEAAVQRARRILEELRRRAGERDRPQIERDYIDRLLRRF